jgi:hypothetical protein
MSRGLIERLTGKDTTRYVKRDRSSEKRYGKRYDHRVYRVITDDSSTFHDYLRGPRERDGEAFLLPGLRAPELLPDWVPSEETRPRCDDAFRVEDLPLLALANCFTPGDSLLPMPQPGLDASFRGVDLSTCARWPRAV